MFQEQRLSQQPVCLKRQENKLLVMVKNSSLLFKIDLDFRSKEPVFEISDEHCEVKPVSAAQRTVLIDDSPPASSVHPNATKPD